MTPDFDLSSSRSHDLVATRTYSYIVCVYVWCNVNFAYTMYVCIATISSEVTRI